MATRLTLILVVVGFGLVYSQSGQEPPAGPAARPPSDPQNNPLNDCVVRGDTDPTVPYAALSPDTRFCQNSAREIRQQYFYCRGTLDENMNVIDDTEIVEFPTRAEDFWTIVLQYPALSYMDIARKRALFSVIWQLILNGGGGCSGVNNFQDFCVADAIPFYVTEYRESVIITLYNLGLPGNQIDECFNSGVRSGGDLVTRFRGKRALVISIGDFTLNEMFQQNVGPASSINDPSRDPTLRPVILTSFGGNATRYEAMDRVSSSDFASNPNPVNYGLKAGDKVFAFFGSVLVAILLVIIIFGFFIHPFFLS